jgi:hypothetical protein
MGTQSASKAHRDGVAERFAAPAGPKRLDVDRALLAHDDGLRRALELPLLTTATPHEAHTRSLRRTGPGSGERLSLGLRSAIPASARFPRGQDCGSDGRLVTGAQEAAGQRYGTAGTTSGHASLHWAFSDAAVLVGAPGVIGVMPSLG